MRGPERTVSAEDAQALRDILEKVGAASGLEVSVTVEQRDGELHGSFEGHDVGPLIGRRGQTIDALQHLVRRIVFKDTATAPRVVIDADGYRARRAQALCQEADEAAIEVVQTGEEVELDPMPASERRIIHEHLRLRGDVSTHSEGEEPERFLVISPV